MNDQPTPQHDDETALVHAVMNTLDGALHHDIDYSVAEARYLAAALLAAAAKVEASE